MPHWRVGWMVDPIVPALREAARHRGYHLLVSKRRKPGTGDYGKFGLADVKGTPILGTGPDGLTASPQEIEAYLRGGELETWKQSANLPADAAVPKRKTKSKAIDEVVEDGGPRRRASRRSEHAPSAKPVNAAPVRKARAAPKPPAVAKPKPRPVPSPLRIRSAKPVDAKAIAKLLARRNSTAKQAEALSGRLAHFTKAGSGVLVAERGEVIGCLAWTRAPALHRPPSGRIATLVVAERHRRRGVGRALVEEAARLLANAGIDSIEVMSDIDIRSANGFFRKLDFAETSYRFAKALAKPK